MAKIYDVAVVGAGPSGLLAAKAAGQAGFSVALLERKADAARLERACGQTLVSVNDYYFDDVVHYNRSGKRIAFIKSGFSFAYDGPVKNCAAWHIYSPGGNRLPFGLPEDTRKKGDFGAVGIAYDKEILFRCLLEEVRQAGVEVITGIDVNSVTPAAAGVTISGSGKSFAAEYLIAADGCNSRIARMLGFNQGRTFYSYLLSRGWYMRRVKTPASDLLLSSITLKTVAPGLMFIFPRPYADDLNVIFLTLDPRVSLDAVADYFTRENPFFSKWFQGAERLQESASAQYIYSPVLEPYRDRVLLAGDTGACQELENSGAMISGWKAGSAVAAVLKENRVGLASQAIPQYLNWWKSTYIEKCPHEAYLMNFALPYVIDREEDLDYIFGLVKNPLPPCWNPYAAIVHMGGLIQGLVPTIQKERPDLMPKLAAMSRPMTEILAATTAACSPLQELD
jgi:flavin-dependent dehydrogenase